jgi:methylmalonyl-CoA epimerase
VPDKPPPNLDVIRLHHVGILVRDAEAAAETYRTGFGLDVLAVEDHQGTTRVAILSTGDSYLHLIQPLREDTSWGAALRERGEGPHHFALEVADLPAAIASLTASDVRLVDPHPRRDAGSVLSVFLNPSDTGGPLIELVQQIRSAK